MACLPWGTCLNPKNPVHPLWLQTSVQPVYHIIIIHIALYIAYYDAPLVSGDGKHPAAVVCVCVCARDCCFLGKCS